MSDNIFFGVIFNYVIIYIIQESASNFLNDFQSINNVDIILLRNKKLNLFWDRVILSSTSHGQYNNSFYVHFTRMLASWLWD